MAKHSKGTGWVHVGSVFKWKAGPWVRVTALDGWGPRVAATEVVAIGKVWLR